MPHHALMIVLSALLVAAAAASPASADKPDRSSFEGRDRGGDARDVRARAKVRAHHPRRYRYARRYYYPYPYTPWWGPFAGPPGLF